MSAILAVCLVACIALAVYRWRSRQRRSARTLRVTSLTLGLLSIGAARCGSAIEVWLHQMTGKWNLNWVISESAALYFLMTVAVSLASAAWPDYGSRWVMRWIAPYTYCAFTAMVLSWCADDTTGAYRQLSISDAPMTGWMRVYTIYVLVAAAMTLRVILRYQVTLRFCVNAYSSTRYWTGLIGTGAAITLFTERTIALFSQDSLAAWRQMLDIWSFLICIGCYAACMAFYDDVDTTTCAKAPNCP